ncbi:hypothetical protein BC940DRAFT_102048 [Gongronella butleri]|nr:hypothetical protein BC940DRAFT_102048 [Gongronella butleri]
MRIKAFVRFRILSTQDEAPRARVIGAIKDFIWTQFSSEEPLLIAAQQAVGDHGAAEDDDDPAFESEDDDFDLSDLDDDSQSVADADQDDQEGMNAAGGALGPLHPVTVADIPRGIPEALRPLTLSILQELVAWKHPELGQVTIRTLRTSPHLTVTTHVSILRAYDEFRAAHPDDDQHIPSYTLLPMPNNRPRFVTIDSKNFRTFLPKRIIPDGHPARQTAPLPRDTDLPPFVNHMPLFWAAFDFTQVGIASLEALQNGVFLGRTFSGVIKTDGTQAHVSFRRTIGLAKPPPLKDGEMGQMGLEGFSAVGIDPGRKTVVTAAYVPTEGDIDATTTRRAVRRVTLQEHRSLAGEQPRQLALERRKQQVAPNLGPRDVTTMKELETNAPLKRTADVDSFREYATYMFEHRPSFEQFYGEQARKDRFAAYRGRQRAIATTANVIINGSPKYDRQQRSATKKRRNRRRRKKKSRRRRAGRAAAAQEQLAQLQEREVALQDAQVELNQQQHQQQQRRDLLAPDLAAAVEEAQRQTAALEADALAQTFATNRAAQQVSRTTIATATAPPELQEPMRPMKQQFKGNNPTLPGVPLVGFGTGIICKEHNKIRGLPVGKSTMVLKHLEQRQARGQIITIRTDEFKTSKTCWVCGAPAREPLRYDADGHQTYTLHATLVCAHCQRAMGRDDVAAANMLAIITNRATNGTRPAPLTRPRRPDANPPAAPAIAHPPDPPPTTRRRRYSPVIDQDPRPAQRRRGGQ